MTKHKMTENRAAGAAHGQSTRKSRLKKRDPIGVITGPNSQPSQQARVELAIAERDKAKVALEAALQAFERTKLLFEKKATSRQEYEQKEQAVKMAQAELGVANTKLNAAQVDVETPALRMPFDGMIVKYWAEIGSMIKAGDPFVTVRRDQEPVAEEP